MGEPLGISHQLCTLFRQEIKCHDCPLVVELLPLHVTNMHRAKDTWTDKFSTLSCPIEKACLGEIKFKTHQSCTNVEKLQQTTSRLKLTQFNHYSHHNFECFHLAADILHPTCNTIICKKKIIWTISNLKALLQNGELSSDHK